jgi:hypothetical protein
VARMRRIVANAQRMLRQTESLSNLRHDFFRRIRRVHSYRIRRFLEVRELASENSFAGEVALAAEDSLAEEFVTPFQIDNFDFGTCAKLLAVCVLQCGASEDDVGTVSDPLHDGIVHGSKPGSAVRVGEWNTARHFLDVRGRMKAIRVRELPAELRGEQCADGGLARSGGAHHEDDHGSIIGGYGRARNSPSSMWKW